MIPHRRFRVIYSQLALDSLTEFPQREAGQIIRKITRLESGLHGDIKRLENASFGFRLRMGNYRALFDLQGDVILIQKIGNRKDVYD